MHAVRALNLHMQPHTNDGPLSCHQIQGMMTLAKSFTSSQFGPKASPKTKTARFKLPTVDIIRSAFVPLASIFAQQPFRLI